MRHAAAVAIGSSPFVTFGALQVLGGSATPQWPHIAEDFVTISFWLTLSIVLLSGAFGGIAYELLLRKGAIELPHRVRSTNLARKYGYSRGENLIALGSAGRAIVGAAAAATALMVVSPTTAHGAVALGVTAGAAAPALIRLMRRQLMFAADLMARLEADHREAPAKPRPVTAVVKPAQAA